MADGRRQEMKHEGDTREERAGVFEGSETSVFGRHCPAPAI